MECFRSVLLYIKHFYFAKEHQQDLRSLCFLYVVYLKQTVERIYFSKFRNSPTLWPVNMNYNL